MSLHAHLANQLTVERNLRLISRLPFSLQQPLMRYAYRHSSWKAHPGLKDLEKMEVLLEECMSFAGFSFASEGWHPYVEALKEIDTEDSKGKPLLVLDRFYTRFCPEVISELLVEKRDGIFDRPFAMWPWKKQDRPEVSRLRSAQEKGTLSSSLQYLRLEQLLKMIREEGYQPDLYSPVVGFFLIARNGERRFHVTGGNHRLAVMSYLGMATVTVVHDRRLSDVREEEVSTWPAVISGECTEDDALVYFRNWFSANGTHLADRFHLR